MGKHCLSSHEGIWHAPKMYFCWDCERNGGQRCSCYFSTPIPLGKRYLRFRGVAKHGVCGVDRRNCGIGLLQALCGSTHVQLGESSVKWAKSHNQMRWLWNYNHQYFWVFLDGTSSWIQRISNPCATSIFLRRQDEPRMEGGFESRGSW